MSDNKGSKKAPLQNAGEIIERFGGIRPMAAKIDTPVTTVQGWKKRDVIPATRRADILNAAQENNIDLTDLANVSPSVANENETVRAKSKVKSTSGKVKPVSNTKPKMAPKKNEAMGELEQTGAIYHANEKPTPEAKETNKEMANDGDLSTVEHDAVMKVIQEHNRKNAIQTIWIVTILLLVAAAVAAFLLWPSAKKINNLENDVNTLASEVDGTASALDSETTSKLKERMDGLQNQARNLQTAVEQLASEAKSVGQVALGEEGINLSSRISVLEEKLQNFTGLDALNTRIQALENSVPGQEQLAKSVDELRAVVNNGGSKITDGVQRAQNARTALGQTMGGIPGEEMKAAAMLLTLSQMRRSLDRKQPFSDDLALVQKLAGEDNEELQAAINKLAPYADSGILSIGGLTGEFKGLAGEAVAASLAGENLSLKEKAKARFNNVIQLEKDGKLVTGNETQAIMHNAEKYLDAGDAELAIAELKKLDGKAAEQIQPFIQRAEVALLAKRVQDLAAADVLSAEPMAGDAGTVQNRNTIGLERTQRDTEINLDEVEEILNDTASSLPEPVGNESVLPKSDFKGFSSRQ